jgi:hypothetical protein
MAADSQHFGIAFMTLILRTYILVLTRFITFVTLQTFHGRLWTWLDRPPLLYRGRRNVQSGRKVLSQACSWWISTVKRY